MASKKGIYIPIKPISATSPSQQPFYAPCLNLSYFESPGIAGLGWIGPMRSEDGGDFHEYKRAGAAGQMINPSRRKGFGAEALKMVVDYGLNVLELAKVKIGTTLSNMTMARLVEARFKMEAEAEEIGDRFGSDLLSRIGKERWGHYLEEE
ncbi:hypothetical protein TSTA_117880 [Talaromyces stipitatus ATCC 10500]|uniref:N-acetyltransferase domain-containing protein n=1 Tax=Talaromyces stipitatus (strain ATCC 10500 / CBS 375.48 / QM 6759 / NRRL 1006) TaxID=441959 RepID=B8M9L4_TALSN|nr:uncharacterized protein TSTA_117880 [Talaromyces stipitatus ATCC 10500]EED18016.1 hypothetical protein TSTA_117880 [Talaromyces stipitatus ATCC 10500]